jgi:hypothetical protein
MIINGGHEMSRTISHQFTDAQIALITDCALHRKFYGKYNLSHYLNEAARQLCARDIAARNKGKGEDDKTCVEWQLTQ